jgi:hypothetical protein
MRLVDDLTGLLRCHHTLALFGRQGRASFPDMRAFPPAPSGALRFLGKRRWLFHNRSMACPDRLALLPVVLAAAASLLAEDCGVPRPGSVEQRTVVRQRELARVAAEGSGLESPGELAVSGRPS